MVGQKTISEWIQDGFLINAGIKDGTLTPTMSILYLRKYIAGKPLWVDLNNLLLLFNTFDWHDFERVHTSWERLMRRIYHGQKLTYRKLYRLPLQAAGSHLDEEWIAHPKVDIETKMDGSMKVICPRYIIAFSMSHRSGLFEVQIYNGGISRRMNGLQRCS